MSERILVPFDNSPLSARALRHALSNYSAADVHVVYVVDPPDPEFPPWSEPYLAEGAQERWEEWTSELFSDAQQLADEFDAQLVTSMEVGRPARKIVEYAIEHDVDQIVMGSHARTGVSRLLLGSVAESVVRQSPVSVTVVRGES